MLYNPGLMVGRAQDTLVILALLASATACAAAVGCRDASNKEVDWWIALKVNVELYDSVFW